MAPERKWPVIVPDDLRYHLEGVMGYRSFGEAEIWTVVREWLERHGAEPPEGLPQPSPGKGWWNAEPRDD